MYLCVLFEGLLFLLSSVNATEKTADLRDATTVPREMTFCGKTIQYG